MRTTEINTTIVDGDVGLLNNLSTSNKLDLASYAVNHRWLIDEPISLQSSDLRLLNLLFVR